MRLTALLCGCILVATACSNPSNTAQAPAAPAPPYNSEIDIQEVMVHGMDPAAQAFWKGWGEVYDSKGMHDISAKTPEEWKRVVDGAAMVVLTSNTLMLPAYQRKPEAEWVKWAKDASDIATLGKEAAEYQDKAAMEDIGSRLYGACKGCHETFQRMPPPAPRL